MTTHRRFDAVFWIAIAVLLAGTVSCFGYAGMQLNPDGATARHAIDAITPKLRSPLSFERSSPRPVPVDVTYGH